MLGLFDEFLIDLAREAARGVIEGILQRYSVGDLRWHIEHDTNLIEQGLDSPDPRDRALLPKLQNLARRYARYRPKIREAVTTEWFLGWMHRRYPAYAVHVDTPQGRRWLEGNLRYAIDFFFPP